MNLVVLVRIFVCAHLHMCIQAFSINLKPILSVKFGPLGKLEHEWTIFLQVPVCMIVNSLYVGVRL